MPGLLDNLTFAQAEALKKFLASSERPPGTMDYLTLAGFLFAVGNAPEVIMPSEWMPVVFDDDDPNYQSEREFREITAAMLSLYNFVSGGAGEDKATLPPGCRVHDEPMSNFDTAPLGRWAGGFALGCAWVEDSWKTILFDEIEDELNAAMVVLSFFSDRRYAEECFEGALHDGVSNMKDKNLEEFAARMLRIFPAAMEIYSGIGRSAFQSLMKLGLYEKAFAEAPGPGRNEPCPCGSGKKYKKCCM